MTISKRIRSIFGVLLFLAGVLLGIGLSSTVVWGELEARIYDNNPPGAGLGIRCPLMLAPGEAGIIRATIANTSSEKVSPAINAEISHTGGARQVNETLILAPGEAKSVQWEVNSSDVIFNRLSNLLLTEGQKYAFLLAQIDYPEESRNIRYAQAGHDIETAGQ